MRKVKVAMIGVGAISGIYLENLTKKFHELELIGVCDLIPERSQKASEKYGVKVYGDMYEAFADPEVEIVLNLTRPHEHYAVTKAALEAGKHVYTEKPLGASYEEGCELAKLAKEKGLLIAGAPDTFLGAGIQTCRKLIDDGYIGTPIGAAAFMICHGHETWHPDPAFYYQYGGGPMLDMGPYYITALVNLLGRVRGVTGVTKKAFEKRIITSEPKRGEIIDVDVPTTVTGILDFECGATGTIITTFDVYYPGQARLEIYGTEGTLFVPDPNTFGGPIRLLRPENKEVQELPLVFDYSMNSRGLGLADMAKAIVEGRDMRAGLQQIHHVLEIMTSFEKSSNAKAYHPLETPYVRGEAMKHNPIHGILD